MLASGGLRGEVLLWDLAGLRRVMTAGAQVSEASFPVALNKLHTLADQYAAVAGVHTFVDGHAARFSW